MGELLKELIALVAREELTEGFACGKSSQCSSLGLIDDSLLLQAVEYSYLPFEQRPLPWGQLVEIG